ncbi:MAG: hypothetical protein JNL82_26525 [Myxococcales bacterium]|nr:hypothetical protein [Myxococcales bacterium]
MRGGLWVGIGLLSLAACGGGTPNEGQTDGASETQGDTTQSSQVTVDEPTVGTNSMSQGDTTNISGMSESQTDTSATATVTASETSADTSASEPETTNETTQTSQTSQTSNDTGETGDTSAGDTSSGGDDSTGGSGESTEGVSASESSDTSTTEPECIPTEEVCNDLDDDCDNIIDDVDVGMDGICDCLSIALVGNEGANPSAEFQAWLEAQGTTVERINSNVKGDQNVPITKEVLGEYDIVIVDYLVRNYSPEESSTIRTWVEAGGGLMSMTGHTNTQQLTDRHNSIIGAYGLTYNTSAGWFSGPVTQFNPHPITEGLTSISFYGGLFINMMNDGVGQNQVIMTLPQGPVGVAQERVDGRVFVFGDEWVEFDSEWQNIPQIKQFWVQTLAFLGPQNSCLVPQ